MVAVRYIQPLKPCAHHEGNNAVEPWLFGEQAEKIAKNAIQLKYQLHPYLYSYARESYDTGIPILRALIMEYPKDHNTVAIDDQFMFGESFLIAPVIEKEAKQRRIYLPKGDWVDYNRPDMKYSGGTTIEYPVTLETIPMFVKAGAIVPKSPIMPYIGAVKNAPIIWEVFLSDKISQFTLYEDDGETNDYKNDRYSTTAIESQKIDNTIKIEIQEPKQNDFKTEDRNFLLKIHVSENPNNILVNGKTLKNLEANAMFMDRINSEFNESSYYYNEDNQTLNIRIPDNKTKTEILIFN